VKLWLLRHGEAETHAPTDELRQLTERGRRQVRNICTHLQGVPFAGIFASPYARARQTASLAAELLGLETPVQHAGWLVPEADLRVAMAALSALAEGDWLLVTHQPLVGNLASLLIHGHRADPVPFGTASLLELEGLLPLAGGMSPLSLRHPALS
jgi:phosphohistidine phosphatase